MFGCSNCRDPRNLQTLHAQPLPYGMALASRAENLGEQGSTHLAVGLTTHESDRQTLVKPARDQVWWRRLEEPVCTRGVRTSLHTHDILVPLLHRT
jgi:hypothetical protein